MKLNENEDEIPTANQKWICFTLFTSYSKQNQNQTKQKDMKLFSSLHQLY